MKFCLFITFSVCLILCGVMIPNQTRLETLGNGVHSFYTTQRVSHPLITNTIDLGFSFIYQTDTQNANHLRPIFNHLDGESIQLENSNKSIKLILQKLNAREVSTQKLSNTKIVYAYTAKNSKFITDGNHRINIQIAQTPNHTVIGFPVILGSY